MVSAVFFLFFAVNFSIKNIRCDVTFESTGDSNDPTSWPLAEVPNDQYVDPTGWNYDRVSKTSQRILIETGNFENILTDDFQEMCIINQQFANSRENSIAFVRRFVNLLLESASIRNKFESTGNTASGVIEVKLTLEQYKTLTRFSESQENISFAELDSLLSECLYGKYEPPFDIERAIEKVLFIVTQKENWLPIFILIIVLLFVRRIANCKTRSEFMFYVLCLLFISSYLLGYYRMYKSVEIKQRRVLEKHRGIPKRCLAESRSWLDGLWESIESLFFIRKDECEEYHRAILLDPLVEISPLHVFSTVIADFLLAPISHIGGAIAEFATAILGRLPIQYAPIVWFMSSAGFFIILCLILILLSGSSLQIGNRWLAQICVSGRNSGQTTERSLPKPATNASMPTIDVQIKYFLIQESHLKKLMNTGHSNRIEELEPPTKPVQECSKCPKTKHSKSEIEDKAVLEQSPSEKCEKVDQDTPEETVPIISLDSSNKGLLCEVFEKCETMQLKIPHQKTVTTSCSSNDGKECSGESAGDDG